MIYLDNAATSHPKPEIVYKEVERCMREYCANPGRAGHTMAITAGIAVGKVREIIADYFNCCSPMRICFTKNATEALNMAIKGTLRAGDHVITTGMEHNSVVRPLKTLEKDKLIELSIIKCNAQGELDPHDMKKSIKKNTRLVVSILSSNVNGIIMPVKQIGQFCRENGLLFLVDASQGAGTIKIDVKEMSIDMLAFPGHKDLLSPQGTGGLYVCDMLELNPILQGGTGSNSENLLQPGIMPDLLESGTLNTPGIIGLGCGINFIKANGMENLRRYKHYLTARLHEAVKEIPGIAVYSTPDYDNNSGITALRFDDLDSTEVSTILDKKYNIATRGGLHCAPLAHHTLGTLPGGLVRFSMGCFNTAGEVDSTIRALYEIAAGR